MLPTPDKQLELYTRTDVDDFVAKTAVVVSHLHGQTTRNILEIGQRLTAVKTLLGHGAFGSWLTANCRFSTRTATRYMSAAKTFEGKSDTVSELSISVIHALSSSKTSEEARTTALAAVKTGTLTSARQVTSNLAGVSNPEQPKAQPHRTILKADEKVAAARKKLALLLIKAANGSPDSAMELTESAMIPELQKAVAEIKASRAKLQAEFNRRQLALPFDVLE